MAVGTKHDEVHTGAWPTPVCLGGEAALLLLLLL